jgi:hypothetical protein
MIKGRRLWRRWVLANSAGELIGLELTFAIWSGLFAALSQAPGLGPALLSAALMTATGASEEATVGLAQWFALSGGIAGITRSTWMTAALISGVLALGAGSIPMTLASLSTDAATVPVQEPPQLLVLAMASGISLVAGAVLSAAQWVVPRKCVSRAWRWVPANGLAWAIGMPLIFAAIDLAQLASLPGVTVIVMALAIPLAGASVGAIHGVVLVAFAGELAVQQSRTSS